MEFIIVGAGQFGSALTHVYLKQGIRVFCIGKEDPWPEKNQLQKKHFVILCVPTQKIPNAIEQRRASMAASSGIISTAKGLLKNQQKSATEFLTSQFSRKLPLLTLSGPSFAKELMAGKPTALVLAGKNRRIVDSLSKVLSTPQLRIYKSFDPYGVEICGALKNVYAIAAGISDGLKLGDNARSALTTRALAEMTRIGTALGGKTFTFFGLAGVGDLFLTCSSPQSRNYQLGMGLAQKQELSVLLEKLGTVEGAWTANVAQRLCRRRGLRAPLINLVADILNQKINVSEALRDLMSRKVRHEFD